MPLRISINNKYSLPADYWVITAINLQFQEKRARIVIEGWTSKAKYLAGAHCIDQLIYDWYADTWPYGAGTVNILKATYDKIRTLSPFTDAAEE